MSRPRLGHSLLWTFTGAFLAVLLGGVLLQVVILAAVLRPAAQHWRAVTREAIARTTAASVGDAIASGGTDLPAILRRAAGKEPALVFAYRDSTGKVVSSVPPGEGHPGMQILLHALERGRGRRIVATAPVRVNGEKRGELLVVPRMPDRGLWPEGIPRPWVLFLPVAAILAGVAGFLLFRGLARRLEHLEDRVRRVAEGDLDARVADPRRDEIGRLGDALNAMAGRLQESREQLLDADRQRRRFLADVTHDLATPLTTIRGYAETLIDPAVPKSSEETERYLRFIQEEAIRMDALVADLLDLARVESGGIPLDRETIDLADLARAEAERIRPAFVEAGLALDVPLPDAAGPEASADRRRLEQLLSNLLGNALRHVPAGGRVWVRVERAAEGGRLLIVEDDGPGFPAQDLSLVFERFYRGNPARPSGGTGLGLAIVRGIARAHGGDATAENRPGGGARVIVRLPGPVD